MLGHQPESSVQAIQVRFGGTLVALCCLLYVAGCQRTLEDAGQVPTVSDKPVGQIGQAFHFDRNAPTTADSASVMQMPVFREMHAELGLQFRFHGGDHGDGLIVHATGGAGVWLDIDADGFLDAVFVQAGGPGAEPPPPELADRLFFSLDAQTFVDVTAVSGFHSGAGYGQGIAIGDFNNDGFDDVYVTRFGSNQLFENLGDGTFRDVTQQSETDTPLWSTSAAWADWDCDGDLDLFVCNYLDYDLSDPLDCRRKEDGVPFACHPANFSGLPNAAFQNEGNGQFREVGEGLRLRSAVGTSRSLGVAIAELTGDRWPDIYVANDVSPNTLYAGEGGRYFREVGRLMGCATGRNGEVQASMGIAFGDYDNNGMMDLCLTHFSQETNTLYANQPAGGFVDVSKMTGLTDVSTEPLGFGTVMHDFNSDGHQDMFVANGHVHDNRAVNEPYRMRPQLLSFNGRQWLDGSTVAGPYFEQEFIGRGVSSGDYDRDGDMDLLVGHQKDEAALLRNESSRGHWLKLRLIGTTSNRQGIGSQVTLVQSEQKLVAQIPGGTSYCATQEPILIFGLGKDDSPAHLAIRWSDGTTQNVVVEYVDRSVVVIESRGK